MAKKQRKLNPNRFQKQDSSGLFSLDSVRINTFKWGLIAGAGGGILMTQSGIVWQVLGVFTVVFVSNYHIAKAARQIPRWHATVISLAGAMIAMLTVIVIGTILLAALLPGTAPPGGE